MNNLVQKIDDFFTVDGLKKNWDVLAVASIFVLAIWFRYMPAGGMQYLQALDPYMIFRLSQHLAFEGNLPALDFMRYFPYANPVHKLQMGNIVFPAVFYWLGPFLFFDSYMGWAQFYPALMGGIGTIFAYLLGREIWGKVAGVSGAFFLATIAGAMHRTSAGFFEKEPIGTMFMMMSLYFFVRAWKRDEWVAGIGSGLALAGFTLSWGGASMAWMLYPLTVGTVMLLDEDIDSLVKAYTPLVLLGGGLTAILNPAKSLWFTDSLFLANLGLLGLLWSRKLVEEFKLVEQDQLKYYVPGMSALGLFLLFLSPLYSDFIASKMMGIIGGLIPGGNATIAGTVAENQAASLGQLVSQLGAISSVRISPVFGYLSNVVGPWPLAFIAVGFLGTSVILMVLRKYGVLEKTIHDSTYYYTFGAVFLGWIIVFAAFFGGSIIFAVAPSVLAVMAGMIILYTFSDFGERDIDFRWYYLLPMFWIMSNVLGAVLMSRLVFLSSFSVAIGAGYAFSIAVEKLGELDLGDILRDIDHRQVWMLGVILLVTPVMAVNVASGYSAAQSLGGSPNQAWTQSLDYMREETQKGSVIMSWWDYGYWFESIGRRPAIADGGNAGYYTSNPGTNKVNYPVADFFTSSNPDNHTDLFRRHSVDYLVLDNSMIGKYAAVSQISNRDNSQFQSMQQMSTSGGIQNSISQSGNRTVVQLQNRRARAYVPINRSGNSIGITGVSTLQVQGGRINVGCVLTEEGRKDFRDENERFCLAEDPYYSLERAIATNGQARVILVPEVISEASLVRLYLMDGYGVDFVEKIPEASNGYVKMWKVDIQ